MADNMSLDETNKMRVSLGMKPILTNGKDAGSLSFKPSGGDESEEEPASTLETREAAAHDNWLKLKEEQDRKKRSEAKKQKLIKERDAAQRFAKLEGKGLGEIDGDDVDTKTWLMSSKKRQKKVEKKRAKQSEQERLDLERQRRIQYTEDDLVGQSVGHEVGDFDVGEEHILTLKDKGVEDDGSEDGDELENAQIREKEKREERLKLKKKRPVYDPNEVDETAEHTILGQYDEEISGKKHKTFKLGGHANDLDDMQDVRSNTANGADTKTVKFSLDFLEDSKPVSDYQDVPEVKIKKHKKKKDKQRKRKTEDDEDLEVAGENVSAEIPQAMDVDSKGPAADPAPSNSRKRNVDDLSYLDDEDLQEQLASQRRVALKKRKVARPEDIARHVREEKSNINTPMRDLSDDDGPGMVLDEMSGWASRLDAKDIHERLEMEAAAKAAKELKIKQKSETPAIDVSGDVSMGPPDDDDHDMKDASATPAPHSPNPNLTSATGIEEEKTLDNTGLGGALALLRARGVLKSGESEDLNAIHRERQRFLAEKQRQEQEQERKAQAQRRRDRESGKFERMSQREAEQHKQWENKQRDHYDSRQMAEIFNRDYKPNVELKYTDEFGRSMNQREAFKHLSHQFHGKGSGKGKTEKRLKKIEAERKREAKSTLDASETIGMNSVAAGQAIKNKQAGVRLQ